MIGKVLIYMRLFYVNCGGDCFFDIESLGYYVVNFDVDIKDYFYNLLGII